VQWVQARPEDARSAAPMRRRPHQRAKNIRASTDAHAAGDAVPHPGSGAAHRVAERGHLIDDRSGDDEDQGQIQPPRKPAKDGRDRGAAGPGCHELMVRAPATGRGTFGDECWLRSSVGRRRLNRHHRGFLRPTRAARRCPRSTAPASRG
jgi:hypothetical protein